MIFHSDQLFPPLSTKTSFPKPASHVNNSFELKENINNFIIPLDYVLLSLDVNSLFTNIPCDLVLKSLDRRFSHLHNKCKIPFHEIRTLVEYLFDNTYFLFNDTIYKQTFGTPMGSPISPLFADIVMEDLETDCLNRLKHTYNCTPLFYFRYVDDTILCVKKDHVDTLLQTFNSYNEHLKFTHEIEENNSIHFLDITLIRNNNRIMTNWYQKPIASQTLKLQVQPLHSTKKKYCLESSR